MTRRWRRPPLYSYFMACTNLRFANRSETLRIAIEGFSIVRNCILRLGFRNALGANISSSANQAQR